MILSLKSIIYYGYIIGTVFPFSPVHNRKLSSRLFVPNTCKQCCRNTKFNAVQIDSSVEPNGTSDESNGVNKETYIPLSSSEERPIEAVLSATDGSSIIEIFEDTATVISSMPNIEQDNYSALDDIAKVNKNFDYATKEVIIPVRTEAIKDDDLIPDNDIVNFDENKKSIEPTKNEIPALDEERIEIVEAILAASGDAVAHAEASMPLEVVGELNMGTQLVMNDTITHLEEVQQNPATSDAAEEQTEQEIVAPSVKKVFKFAVPAIGVWLCGPLLSMIDTSSVGILSGTIQQAALNPAVAVTDYAALLIAFLYAGGTNLVASAQEAEKNIASKPQTTKVMVGAMQLSTYVGIGLGTVLFVFARNLLKAIIGNDSMNPAVFAAAMKYVRIRALGMPAAAIIGTAQAACLGMQDIRSPLYVLAAAAIVNFFGDMIMVRSSHALIGGAAGAAWATVFSQYAAVLLFSKWLCHGPKKEKPKPQVMDITNAIMELTGMPSSTGANRREKFRESALVTKTTPSRVEKDIMKKKRKNPVSSWIDNRKTRTQEKQTAATTGNEANNSFSVRGLLEGKFRKRDFLKPPPRDILKKFKPFVVPVTTTQVGRVSGYVAMSHVVSSSLGTMSMAAQQIIVSLFYCLCPIADSLNLTAQSLVPGIAQKKASKKRTAALKETALNLMKAGLAFGGFMSGAVCLIPFLNRFFTSDPVVISLVNSVVPLLVAFFSVHGVLCGMEGMILGQKDLKYLGSMYGSFFVAVPLFMLPLKRAALAGSKNVNLSSVWTVFVGYQMFRAAAFVIRVAQLQRRNELQDIQENR